MGMVDVRKVALAEKGTDRETYSVRIRAIV